MVELQLLAEGDKEYSMEQSNKDASAFFVRRLLLFSQEFGIRARLEGSLSSDTCVVVGSLFPVNLNHVRALPPKVRLDFMVHQKRVDEEISCASNKRDRVGSEIVLASSFMTVNVPVVCR